MTEFVIVPEPEQELHHALLCFDLRANYIKRDAASISDSSLLNREYSTVDGLEQKVRCFGLQILHSWSNGLRLASDSRDGAL
jgi:hypothetical protein